MKSGFPSPPSIFLPRSLYLSSRPGLFHFLMALSLYKTWKMFSLAFADNVEILSEMGGGGWGGYQARVKGLWNSRTGAWLSGCRKGWIQSHKSPLAPMRTGSVISFSYRYIICCASSAEEEWHRGEITSFNQNYKSASACSHYLLSHRAPYLFRKAPKTG